MPPATPAACVTCRRKCRKCGRERPSCAQCTAKGDTCEGYPLKFCGVASRGKLSGKAHPFADIPRPNRKKRTRSVTAVSTEGVAATSIVDGLSPSTGNNVLSPRPLVPSPGPPVPSPPVIEHPPSVAEDPSLDGDAANTGMLPGPPEVDWSSREAFLEFASIIGPSAPLQDQLTGISPTTSHLSRDDELLQPLDAISGTNEAEGQRILIGMNKFSLSQPADHESGHIPPSTTFFRIPWASRIAAVRFDALPSLSFPLDKTLLPFDLDQDRVQFLLQYFDETLCPKLVVDETEAWSNPFQQYILPLALQFSGVLFAALGLSLGHFSINHFDTPSNEQESLQYRLQSIKQVTDWLEGSRSTHTDPCLLEAGFAIVLILVLHDICETGVSSGGMLFKWVTSICRRHSGLLESSIRDRPCMKFLLGALSWLHMIRCIPKKYDVMLPDRVREIAFQEICPRTFECFSGCPLDLFLAFTRLLENRSDIAQTNFEESSMETAEARSIQQHMNDWARNGSDNTPGETNSDYLANAFRHTFLLHSIRLLDNSVTARDPKIQQRVSDILNAASEIPLGSKGATKLLLPLFVAGTESMVPYQQDYVLVRVDSLLNDTGFRNLAATAMLKHIWKQRKSSGQQVKAWMDYFPMRDIMETHDYLAF